MESDVFELEIVTPTNHQTLSVEWVELESPTGSFFVGPNHAPLVSIIKKKSTLSYKKRSEKLPDSIFVHDGFFKVSSENKAMIILSL